MKMKYVLIVCLVGSSVWITASVRWTAGWTGRLTGEHLVLSLFALRPSTLCCKMYIQRVRVFTFFRYLYLQPRTGIKPFYHPWTSPLVSCLLNVLYMNCGGGACLVCLTGGQEVTYLRMTWRAADCLRSFSTVSTAAPAACREVVGVEIKQGDEAEQTRWGLTGDTTCNR